ncbi:MAG: hypothetical protein HF308_17100 [Ignavibacteria bacterium]|jgi:hypothetical protein|nr:hypothetical protein [Ignavibacteria bacterium]
MSKYTVQLKTLIDLGYNLFDFDYPIFDPAYKTVLENKIKDWYYFREIGLETPAQFKQFLKAKLNMIMPYYNQLYTANEVFKTYDPYKNKNVTTTDTRTGTSESNGSSTAKEVYSDTPQSELGNSDYATSITTNSGDSGGTATTTEEYTSTIAGHDGMKYPTDILMGLRQSFINIDKMIIEELSDLFMNIY